MPRATQPEHGGARFGAQVSVATLQPVLVTASLPCPSSDHSPSCPAQAQTLTLPLLTMEEKVRTSSSSMAVPTADLAAPGPHASLWAPMTT